MRRGNNGINSSQAGFTLIEIIAVLILIGLLTALAGSGLVSVVQGYLFAQESTSLSQKAQLGLTRLTKEFRLCYDCDDDTPYEFTNSLGERTLTLKGQEVRINGDILVDQVEGFELTTNTTNNKMIEITLELGHRQADSSLTFTTSIFPRNTYE